MNDKLIFRSFNNEDYAIILEWWNWWWGNKKGIQRKILPHNDYCYIIEKNNIPIVSGFLYVDKHAPMGYLTFVVSNPEYKEKDNLMFKGFIDAIIKVPKKRGTGFTYWILDWKTAGSYGWRRDKKQDILMTAQLILYKHFWSRKHEVPLKDIRCGFIL